MQLLHGLRRLAISNWDVGQDPGAALVVIVADVDDTLLGELPRIFDMICCMKWPLSDDGDLRLLLPNADLRNDGLLKPGSCSCCW